MRERERERKTETGGKREKDSQTENRERERENLRFLSLKFFFTKYIDLLPPKSVLYFWRELISL